MSIYTSASSCGHQLLNSVWKHLSSWNWENQRGLRTNPSLAANTTALFILAWLCWAWTSKAVFLLQSQVAWAAIHHRQPQFQTTQTAQPFGVAAPHPQFPCSPESHHCCFPWNCLEVNCSSVPAAHQHPPPTLNDSPAPRTLSFIFNCL